MVRRALRSVGARGRRDARRRAAAAGRGALARGRAGSRRGPSARTNRAGRCAPRRIFGRAVFFAGTSGDADAKGGTYSAGLRARYGGKADRRSTAKRSSVRHFLNNKRGSTRISLMSSSTAGTHEISAEAGGSGLAPGSGGASDHGLCNPPRDRGGAHHRGSYGLPEAVRRPLGLDRGAYLTIAPQCCSIGSQASAAATPR